MREGASLTIENLVAEGDAVVARFVYEMTVPITTPDIFQELGKLMPPESWLSRVPPP